MNKKRLFQYLNNLENLELITLLDSAYDEMSVEQRHAIFYETTQKMPQSEIDGKELLKSIYQFYQDSKDGEYYQYLDLNSKNYDEVPDETDLWFDTISDYLKDATQLSNQGEYQQAVKCFECLYDLIDMSGNEEIVFGEEVGTWMIHADMYQCLVAYFKALSKTKESHHFVQSVIPYIKSYDDHLCKAYEAFCNVASNDQKELFDEEIAFQKIKISSLST